MNCQRFEDIVNDIAREQMLDVSLRSEALAHSRACERCALRLEDESAMTLRLKIFAASFESVSAPVRIETELLAAFGSPAVVPTLSRGIARPRYWIAGIAAVLLVVFALAAFRARPLRPLRPSTPAVDPTSAVSVAQAGSPAIPTTSPAVPASDSDHQARLSVPAKLTLPAPRNRRSATATTNRAKPSGPPGTNEIATDFMPVTYGAVVNLAEGGQMVRVELPRSAMASFGLPVNMDRANERVKADVLLGVDGLAHAIRFVR